MKYSPALAAIAAFGYASAWVCPFHLHIEGRGRCGLTAFANRIKTPNHTTRRRIRAQHVTRSSRTASTSQAPRMAPSATTVASRSQATRARTRTRSAAGLPPDQTSALLALPGKAQGPPCLATRTISLSSSCKSPPSSTLRLNATTRCPTSLPARRRTTAPPEVRLLRTPSAAAPSRCRLSSPAPTRRPLVPFLFTALGSSAALRL